MTDTNPVIERFRKEFGEYRGARPADNRFDAQLRIEAFISTELRNQATELLGEVENKKAVSVAIYGNMPAPHDETYKTGYNKAIDDVLASLRSKWERK